MKDEIQAAGLEAISLLENAKDLPSLDQVKVAVLGKKSKIQEVLSGMKALSPQERAAVGEVVNLWKKKIETCFDQRRTTLKSEALAERLKSETIDFSFPSRRTEVGSLHPVTQTLDKIVSILRSLGFSVVQGPEIESEFLNFEAVNIPKNHPARDMQDTFFMKPGYVLRTHTSPVQMRSLLTQELPVRVICPGAVYRCDSDATHSPMFHQVEALWVDRQVRLTDLRGTLEFLAQELFGPKTKIRLRTSYFPFVEPGLEVDVSCFRCQGQKSHSTRCPVCKDTHWLEIAGAGMVHQKLFEAAGLDPSQNLRGFAFGLGIERIAMQLFQISDLRTMFHSELRFLKQFQS